MTRLLDRWLNAAAQTLAALADLVLPNECGGCGAPGGAVCPDCTDMLSEPPMPARPTPAPAGLPPCLTGGDYAGARRELILAYKERGRRDLARPLGAALARVVAAGWPVSAGPLALIPVPATAAAVRARHGDHMLRLARVAQRELLRLGRSAVVVPALRALPKTDSSGLDRAARAEAALAAFRVRAERVAALREVSDAGGVALLDDVLTTGSTLGAVASRVVSAGVPVAFATTLAATRLRLSRG